MASIIDNLRADLQKMVREHQELSKSISEYNEIRKNTNHDSTYEAADEQYQAAEKKAKEKEAQIELKLQQIAKEESRLNNEAIKRAQTDTEAKEIADIRRANQNLERAIQESLAAAKEKRAAQNALEEYEKKIRQEFKKKLSTDPEFRNRYESLVRKSGYIVTKDQEIVPANPDIWLSTLPVEDRNKLNELKNNLDKAKDKEAQKEKSIPIKRNDLATAKAKVPIEDLEDLTEIIPNTASKKPTGINFRDPDALAQILNPTQASSSAPTKSKSTDFEALLQDVFPQNKNLNSTKNACPVRAPGKQNLINNPLTTPTAAPKSNFEKYQQKIFKHEGGYSDNKNDKGGKTNKGITLATFKQFAKSDLGVEPTPENLKALTDAQATIIYKKRYWDVVKGDKIKSGSIAYALFDFNVNAGGNAVKVMQETLNEMGYKLTVDGGLGEKSLNAINEVDSKELFDKLQANRKQYYKDLIEADPTQVVFEKGWMSRVDSITFDDPKEEPSPKPEIPKFDDLSRKLP